MMEGIDAQIFLQGCDAEKVDETSGDRKTIVSVNIKLSGISTTLKGLRHITDDITLITGRVDKASARSYNVTTLLRRDVEAIGEGKEVI